MKRALFFAAALLLAVPAYASDKTDVMAAINGFNDALNRNDAKTAGEAHAPQAVIIDEFAPHLWQGASAFKDWLASFGADAKTRGVSAPQMKLYRPLHVLVEEGRGYAVVPALYSFKLNGKLTHERGLFTFAMQKVDASWKIAGWSWTQR
jgi:hypothetical protein